MKTSIQNKISTYFSTIIHKITVASDSDELIKYELKLFALVLSPMMMIASFVNIIIGTAWNIPLSNIVSLFLILNFTALTIIILSNVDTMTPLKIHVISISIMVSIFYSFLFYYKHIGILYWFIVIIIIFFANILTSKTLFIYLAITSIVTYVLSSTFYFSHKSSFDPALQLTEFVLLSFVLIAGFLNKYLYSLIMSKKMKTYCDLLDQNEEMNALYEEIIASESTLKDQNEQLNIYNAEILAHKERLEYLSYNDTLTELPNRKMVLEQLELLIDMHEESQHSFAVVFIDLDNFKKINDSFGHSVGDELVVGVTKRLVDRLDKKDLLGRLGGDEFVLLIRRHITDETLYSYVNSFCECFEDEFFISNSIAVKITASFGIALWPIDAVTPYDLLKAADTALYKAKDLGKNTVYFYHKDMKEEILSKINLENQLIHALKYNEFYLEYQPIYRTQNQSLTGFEALIRWKTKDNVRISPGEFIPLAEETGLIHGIGEWVLTQVCEKIKEFSPIRPEAIKIAINISAIQMKGKNFVNRMKEIIINSGISPVALEFEITESVFINNKESAIHILSELKDFGIKIVMDDFGTGYSSLNYLLDLPIDKLKIDKSFIDTIGSENNRHHLVGSIIDMVHTLHVDVVAEGVETLSQLEYLERENCDFIQGFYLGRPISEEQMEELLKQIP